MTIGENLTEFAGKPVEDWLPEETKFNPATTHYRLRMDYDDAQKSIQWVHRFAAFLNQPNADQTTALIVGMWGQNWADGMNDADDVIEALVAARDKLPNLRALFLGDITYDENEISWIEQGDISPIFHAYPDLEILGVRGGNNLRVGRVQHAKLKKLIIESGGLRREITQDVIMADLPALEHLELWLGTANYGGTTTPEDLAPLLSGDRFPNLTYLGLRDYELADELAGVLANAPILNRIRTLDLSLGTLGDEGAAALLNSPLVRKLKKLDLHHHFCSNEMMEQLKALPIEVDVSERKDDDRWGDERWRFVAVSE